MRALIAAAEQDYDSLPMTAAIDTIPRTDMNAQFNHTFAYGIPIAEVTGLNLTQADTNTGSSGLIAHAN